MKTFRHFWRYLAKLFLDSKMYQTKVVEKLKTDILCSINYFFFRKLHRLWNNSEICGGDWDAHLTSQYGACALHAGSARLHALIRMHTPTRPGTNMHSRAHTSITNTAFPQQQWFANAPQCYVIRTLPVLFKHKHIMLHGINNIKTTADAVSYRAFHCHVTLRSVNMPHHGLTNRCDSVCRQQNEDTTDILGK
jgi:hypothetical protein